MKIGSLDVSKIYLGSDVVDKAYLGSDLVYSSTPPRLPSEYQELQYITSSLHSAAFKVKYTINSTSGFKLKFHSYYGEETTTAFNEILGMYASSGYVDVGIGRSADNASSNVGIERIHGFSSGNSSARANHDVKFVTNGPFLQECSLINKTYTDCDGSTGSHTWNYNNSNTTNKYVGIFATWNLSTSSFSLDSTRGSVTIGYLALYNGSNLTYEFIPCKRKYDNVAGMYDLVNNVFHPSETGTAFVAGPSI